MDKTKIKKQLKKLWCLPTGTLITVKNTCGNKRDYSKMIIYTYI